MAQEVVVMAAYDAINDDILGMMIIFGLHSMLSCRLGSDNIPTEIGSSNTEFE